MLRVYDNTARYVDQGGGKRKGAFAVYLEPWHADVMEFLDLKKNHGKEEARARDLFYALWTPDLFMRRVEANANWSLFCPDEAPGLADVHGAAFDELYERYEREGRARRVVPAQQVWFKIIEAQMETGTPYMLYKDAANAKYKPLLKKLKVKLPSEHSDEPMDSAVAYVIARQHFGGLTP